MRLSRSDLGSLSRYTFVDQSRWEIGSVFREDKASYDPMPSPPPPPPPVSSVPQASPYMLHNQFEDDLEDVSRRELEALRQRTDESVSSFISRWHGKIVEIVDIPSERGQIQIVLRSLQSRISKHVVKFPEAHPSYAPQQYRPRAPCPTYDQTYQPQTLALPYYATQGIERPPVSYTATGQPCYAAQFIARPTTSLPQA
ncbi:hypothetical protein CK203_087903 [Vitis vinifera]|uniref:Uncharacterized protein n=1 Tax=Vitis vinifera TaxID=29760 RepID=A0A438DQX0_VITVI|nr:hypothetical protein CK203_087903 [Vitis vinifera]